MWMSEELSWSLTEFVDLELNCIPLDWIFFALDINGTLICVRMKHYQITQILTVERLFGCYSFLLVSEYQIDPIMQMH